LKHGLALWLRWKASRKTMCWQVAVYICGQTTHWQSLSLCSLNTTSNHSNLPHWQTVRVSTYPVCTNGLINTLIHLTLNRRRHSSVLLCRPGWTTTPICCWLDATKSSLTSYDESWTLQSLSLCSASCERQKEIRPRSETAPSCWVALARCGRLGHVQAL